MSKSKSDGAVSKTAERPYNFFESSWLRATGMLRDRLAAKRTEYEDYRRHHEMRTREQDLHGMWDCAINMAEVSASIDALEWCLAQLNGSS